MQSTAAASAGVLIMPRLMDGQRFSVTCVRGPFRETCFGDDALATHRFGFGKHVTYMSRGPVLPVGQ